MTLLLSHTNKTEPVYPNSALINTNKTLLFGICVLRLTMSPDNVNCYGYIARVI